MKKILLFLVNILAINQLILAQSVTIVPTNPLSPTAGTMNYNNATNQLQYWNSAAWIPITNAASGTGWALSGNNINNNNTGNVGIGTNSPKATFHVTEGKTVLFGADTTGSGNKLIWYGSKGAFRAGTNAYSDWNNVNYNVARYSVAMGENTNANGYASFAMGTNSQALDAESIAMGQNCISSAEAAISLGSENIASGPYAAALGSSNIASGQSSIAVGYNCISSGINSLAMGLNNTASGNFITALGANANTNNHSHSFCFSGANAGIYTNNTADKQMMMKFDNYTFFLGNTGNYVYLLPASNGWAYTSDRNKKENFEEMNGESVLKKISNIPFYSWNFKDKTVKQYRHYGIMAQDFYNNFGKDNLGVIGNDTTVSALDLLGVAYSGIKALEKRTAELSTKNEEFRMKNDDLAKKNEKLTYALSEIIARLESLETNKKEVTIAKK